MAEDNDDGFNPDAMKAAKKEEMDKLSISIDNSEQVLNEFKFLTQVNAFFYMLPLLFINILCGIFDVLHHINFELSLSKKYFFK